jgi:dimethylargininase
MQQANPGKGYGPMFTHAIARRPGKNFAQGLTTSFNAKPPQYDLLCKQHETYLETIKSCGLEVTLLDPLPDYPDAYFVEDTAVVTPDVAVITNPGAKARNGEEDFMAPVLAGFRKTEHILAPGTVDGGDVLQVGNHFFIGLSERTNKEGAAQLGRILESYGNTWAAVEVGAGLHFKSSVNYVGKNTLLVTADFAEHAALSKYNKIVLEKAEAYAANTLLVNEHLLMPVGYPDTRKQLKVLGFDIIELETSEVRKMDGGLTCMSIRF